MEMKTSVSLSALYRAVQTGSLIRHSSSTILFFTDNSRPDQIKFSMVCIEYKSRKSTYQFKNMYDYIHVDEK